MIASLVLAGVGLTLLPPGSAVRRRLSWLAGRRWTVVGLPAPVGSESPTAPSGPDSVGRRSLRSLADRPLLAVPVLAVIAGWLAGPLPGLLAGLAGGVLGYCWRLLRVERRLTAELTALSDAVAAMVAEHTAGATLAVALSRAAPHAGRYQAALWRAGRLGSLGQQPAAALAGEPALARIAVAVALVSRSGAAVGEVLRRTRSDLQSEQRIRRAVAEAMAGPRSSAMLLAALPAAGLALGVALGADPQRVLLHTTVGLAALTAGVLLNLSGLCWTVRLTTARRS
ncbi:MAG: type II secretion system F family protein [Jatrophihabitantaceae bacterium]